jgi:hypothetical protein
MPSTSFATGNIMVSSSSSLMTFLLPNFSHPNHVITMARAKDLSVRTIRRKSKMHIWPESDSFSKNPIAITTYITKSIELM